MGDLPYFRRADGAAVDEDETLFLHNAIEGMHRFVVVREDRTGMVVDVACRREKPAHLFDTRFHLCFGERGLECLVLLVELTGLPDSMGRCII